MSSAVRSLIVSLALLAAAACASAPKGEDSQTSAGGTISPPQLISGGPRPELRVPPPLPGRSVVARLDIEVMVDAMGNPDIATFKVTGRGSELNQDALRTWIAAQRFRPARLDGQPVPGLFKMSMEARRR
jgi:hypothetical protein